MVSLDDAVVARLARFGHQFEILVDPQQAEPYMEGAGEDDGVLDILAVDDVFVDWSEGDRASAEQLQEAFETTEVAAIALRILREGEIQLTQDQRKAMLERKHKRIVDHIARNAWNPQTKNPHPRDRIERALQEGKWHTDPLRPVEEQIKAALATLRPLLPIAFARVKVALKVPTAHAGRASSQIRNLGDLRKEEWQSDGSYIAVLEIPAGAQGEVYDALNSMTHGEVETRLIE